MEPPADFYRLYEGLPRQGPGSDALTLAALHRLGPLPSSPRVLDLGCGAGRQTLVLARALGVPIVAVDRHPPFLADLERRAASAGLAHLVQTRLGDIASLDVPPRSIDLVWSEGAIYAIGFEQGLRAWRAWLAPGGRMAITECSWLVEDRPAEVVAFWQANYPAMGTVAANCDTARRAGLEVLDAVPLPASAWWDDYYVPLLARADDLAPEARANDALAAAIAEARQEVDLFRRYSDAYGYVFYLLQG